MGNRLSRTHNSAQDSYTYYPGTHRLQTVLGAHPELFQYDADGNTTTRIPGAAHPGPITAPADYTYNSHGQRIKKAAAAQSIYHYDLAGQLIAETDTAGNLIKAYIWLHGQPLAMITADNRIYYYHNDHLGTPQRMTDTTAALVWEADYLPFGQADVTIATVENNLRFAGQYYDSETGLHYNWHRYYDPTLGRYLRADPIGLDGGINLYSYVQNNPIVAIDPYGLKSCTSCDQCPCGTWTSRSPSYKYGGFIYVFSVEAMHIILDCDCSSASASFIVQSLNFGFGSPGAFFQGIKAKYWGACNSNEIKFGGLEASGGMGYGIVGGGYSGSGGFGEGSATGGVGFGVGGFYSFGGFSTVVN